MATPLSATFYRSNYIFYPISRHFSCNFRIYTSKNALFPTEIFHSAASAARYTLRSPSPLKKHTRKQSTISLTRKNLKNPKQTTAKMNQSISTLSIKSRKNKAIKRRRRCPCSPAALLYTEICIVRSNGVLKQKNFVLSVSRLQSKPMIHRETRSALCAAASIWRFRRRRRSFLQERSH